MRKRLFILVAVLFSTINFSLAQITFQKTFGGTGHDWGSAVMQTTDGGYIIAGYTNNFGAGGGDVYLIKTDSHGDSLWTKTFGGTGTDIGRSVQQTSDGGYIITGNTTSFGAGDYNVYLIKTNANGDLLWTKTFGGAGDENGWSVQQTSDGGYIITGNTTSFGASILEVYLVKTDAFGDSLWTKTLNGTTDDNSYSVQQTTDGGYIITGYAFDNIYFIKTDANGNALWSKTFGGTNYEQANSVQQTNDGGYIIIGYTYSFGTGNGDVYLIKTDSNGDTLWTKTIGGTNAYFSISAQQTTDGGYIITGYTYTVGMGDNVYLIKTDSSGNSLWTKTFGGLNSDIGYSVQQTIDGGYIITGYTNSFGAGNYRDVYLIKTDANGNSGCNQTNPATITGSTATQVVSPSINVSSPNTIITTPATLVGSGGGIVNTLCASVGINEIILDSSFIISPNPSAGNFFISFKGTIMKGNVEILNILGENVFSENIFNESKREIHLKNICAGIYFVKVIDGEKYFWKKIIIE